MAQPEKKDQRVTPRQDPDDTFNGDKKNRDENDAWMENRDERRHEREERVEKSDSHEEP